MNERPVTREELNRVLHSLGLDPSDPEHMREWHADRNYLARQRRYAEQMGPWFKRAILGIALPAIIYATWEGTIHILKAAGDKLK